MLHDVFLHERENVGSVGQGSRRFSAVTNRRRLALPDTSLQHSNTAIVAVGESNRQNPSRTTNDSEARQTKFKFGLFVILSINAEIIQFIEQELVLAR